MSKPVFDKAAKAAGGSKLNPKNGHVEANAQAVADPLNAAALAAAVKGVAQQKVGAAPAQPAKPAGVAKIAKPDLDKDDSHKDTAPTTGEGQGEHLAMVDGAAAQTVGLVQVEAAQDAGGSSSDSSNDDDGSDTPLIIGGLVLIGGGIAAAAAGGGNGGGGSTPTPTNAAPTFSAASATATFAENTAATTVVYKAAATDTAGDTLTYSLGGADAALFNINASTGEVTFKASPNFEAPADAGANNVYDVTVTAKDAGGLTATQNVAVTVTNVNETPTFAAATATATVAENIATTAQVFKAAATDVDASTTLTYSLSGADAALFNIDAATGVVTFKASPNFEAPADAGANNVYDIVVTAKDGGNLSATQNVAITVTNVVEAPAFAGQTATASVAENAAVSAVVFDANATAEAGDTVSYSLGGTDAALFNINSSTGEVTLKAPADFETRPSYAFTVVATSGNNPALTSSQAVTLNVTDVNEAPTVIALTTVQGSIAENTVIPTGANGGVKVATAVVTDDALGTETLSLSGADAASFELRGNDLYYIGASPNFEAKSSYAVTVNVDDTSVGATPDASTNFTFTVANAIDLASTDGGALGNPLTLDAAGNPLVDTLSDVNFQFNETPALSETVINNFTDNDFISISGAAAADYSYQKVGNDLVISFNPTVGDLSKITLTGVLAGSADPVFDEATAETALTNALGASDNAANGGYFVSPAAQAATVNIAAGAGQTFNAQGQAGTFVEDLSNESSATIQNFRADDIVRFINLAAGDDVNDLFFSRAIGDIDDLSISYLNPINNTLSTVILDEVLSSLPANQGVFDFQSATTALGRTDFVTFA